MKRARALDCAFDPIGHVGELAVVGVCISLVLFVELVNASSPSSSGNRYLPGSPWWITGGSSSYRTTRVTCFTTSHPWRLSASYFCRNFRFTMLQGHSSIRPLTHAAHSKLSPPFVRGDHLGAASVAKYLIHNLK